ncbi:HupE/UreJ family protein [Methyloceanibacter sp. wino2]|uniref:HupE/UreJ family protein n=1 Tax=Methyloceanibacter sp. wino2 TaxID=2170729 RepID=UPI000D3E2F47|nr:HupE/UreJ family protein [Methyloceanibacter sp. wino2]
MIRLLAVALLLAVLHVAADAHELRPGFLEIRQTGAATYDIRFKVPARGDMRLGLHVRLPAECAEMAPTRSERSGAALVEHSAVRCPDGLADREVSIDGLSGTFTDVVVRVESEDGAVQAARLTPDSPSFTVEAAPTWVETARTYFVLGVEHILLGIDHLLFVLALLLLVRDVWMLVKVITAFTVAHSITLAVAALGWAQIPQAPVEAVIALSIMFVAAEVVRQTGPESDLTKRMPWLVAFAFGLLHGLGFGGALKEIGLPQSDVPLALLTFNLGVEAGQLLFVFTVVGASTLVRRALSLDRAWLRTAVGYGIGSLAAVWFVQRVALFL